MAGLDVSNYTNAQILDAPLLIPNSLVRNGVVDIVKIYDYLAGHKFFGTSQPAQDYIAFKELCHERQKEYAKTVDKIVAEFIKQASLIENHKAASQLLDILCGKYAVEYAVYDQQIDIRVFGHASQQYINLARISYVAGDLEAFEANLRMAQAADKSRSCPAVPTDKKVEGNVEEDEFGSLKFYCPNGHVNERKRHKLIDKCKKCGISVKC